LAGGGEKGVGEIRENPSEPGRKLLRAVDNQATGELTLPLAAIDFRFVD